MAYQSLSSEKYLLESLQQEIQVERENRRRRFRTALATNAMAMLGVSAAVYFALATMPNWLPLAVNGYYRWMAH